MFHRFPLSVLIKFAQTKNQKKLLCKIIAAMKPYHGTGSSSISKSALRISKSSHQVHLNIDTQYFEIKTE